MNSFSFFKVSDTSRRKSECLKWYEEAVSCEMHTNAHTYTLKPTWSLSIWSVFFLPPHLSCVQFKQLFDIKGKKRENLSPFLEIF